MKLLELLGAKKFADMSRDQIADFAVENGAFRRLGHGVNAQVFERNGVVYKFWFKDSAYEAFIDLVQKNQDNRFFPKLKSPIKTVPAVFLRHVTAPNVIKYIKMERLIGLHKNAKVQIFKDADKPLIAFEDAVYLLYGTDKHELDREMVEKLIARLGDAANWHDKIDCEEGKELVDAIYGLAQLIYHKKLFIDLHLGNMAARTDGTPVILDPVADRNDVKKNKFWHDFDERLNKDPNVKKTGEAVSGVKHASK